MDELIKINETHWQLPEGKYQIYLTEGYIHQLDKYEVYYKDHGCIGSASTLQQAVDICWDHGYGYTPVDFNDSEFWNG